MCKYLSIVTLALIFLSANAATWQGDINDVPTWVTVIPRGHSISEETIASQPWWTWGSTESDVFIFAFEDRDNIRLILDFSTLPDGRSQARLFLDRNEAPLFRDEPLSYIIEDDTFHVVQYDDNVAHIQHPNYLFETRSGGWMRDDGHPNYNLVIHYEGIHYTVDRPPDGVFDRRMEVGSSTPGVPKWQTQRLLIDPRPSSAYNRFAATLRMPDAAPYRAGRSTLPSFPYLSVGISSGVIPFFFRLDTYRIRHTPFPGFHTAGIYWINSTSLPPHVNFETPFVFSNFDEDLDHGAEMVMRGIMNLRREHLSDHPYQAVSNNRQSWKVDNSGRWRFGLHLTGFHEYEDIVTIGNESFYSVEGKEFAEWINGRTWPHITFVEATEGYPGSEGIYSYNIGASQGPWLSGESVEHPRINEAPYLTADDELNVLSANGLPPNFRGEYIKATGAGTSAVLYKSSIDNRIHLYNALGGIWHLDNGFIIRMHNTDGDPFIEGWTQEIVRPSEEELEASDDGRVYAMRAANGAVQASLYLAEGYALYWNDASLVVRQTDVPLSDGLIQPPTDQDSWERFTVESAAYLGQDRNPRNLEQWLDNMPGSTMFFEDVAVSDYRIVDSGFRFLLSVSETAEIGGSLVISPLQRLSAGEYIVAYDAYTDRWSIEPAVHTALVFEIPAATLTRLQPQALNLRITNPGNVDREVSFCFVIEDHLITEGEEIECVDSMSVFSSETLEHSFLVTPVEAGDMTVNILDGDKNYMTATFQVEDVARITSSEAIRLSTKNSLPITAIASLVFIGAIWGLTRSWRKL